MEMRRIENMTSCFLALFLSDGMPIVMFFWCDVRVLCFVLDVDSGPMDDSVI